MAAIDATASCIEVLGGRIELAASFGDHTLTMPSTESASRPHRFVLAQFTTLVGPAGQTHSQRSVLAARTKANGSSPPRTQMIMV